MQTKNRYIEILIGVVMKILNRVRLNRTLVVMKMKCEEIKNTKEW